MNHKISIFILVFIALTGRAQTAAPASGSLTLLNGFVIGASLTNDGAGYPEPPDVSVTDITGSNATIVAAISGLGIVTNLTIKSAGSHYSASAALVIAPPPINSNPADIAVPLYSQVTDNLRTWTSGTNYPAGGFYTNYAGIGFYLGKYPAGTNGLGIVVTGTASATTPITNSFPLIVRAAATVYTLMNSEWGKLGFTNGAIDFYGSQGAYASFNLIEGLNLRDHFNGNYQNVVSSNIMSLYWGTNQNVRLDCQGWMLPTNFYSQTLTNIQVRSFGNDPNGLPTLTAITVHTRGPMLGITAKNGQTLCHWPSTPTNYVLQTTAVPGGFWSTPAISSMITNNEFIVTNLTTATNQFFRLTAIP